MDLSAGAVDLGAVGHEERRKFGHPGGVIAGREEIRARRSRSVRFEEAVEVEKTRFAVRRRRSQRGQRRHVVVLGAHGQRERVPRGARQCRARETAPRLLVGHSDGAVKLGHESP